MFMNLYFIFEKPKNENEEQFFYNINIKESTNVYKRTKLKSY